MSLFTKAKCDNPNCQKEFSTDNGGYYLDTVYEDAGVVTFRVSRYHNELPKSVSTYCGIACLMQVLQRCIEEEVK